jgi:mRNA-degrading endonuclease HigB of HigAB toxin-antitoxin module
MLREFWQKHPEAEKVLREWHSVMEHVEFRDFNHVREFSISPTTFRLTQFLILAGITIDWW